MRKQHKPRWGGTLPVCGLVLLGCAATALGQEARLPWADSPYRSFRSPVVVGEAVVLRDEAADAALREELATRLEALSEALFVREGWPNPFAPEDPLRILVARSSADGVRRLVARSLDRRHLVEPTIEIDGSGLSREEIVREAARLFALAAVSSYGVVDRGFLTTAAAEYLSGDTESANAVEDLRAVAAAPTIRLADHARTMGSALLDEFVRAAGGRTAIREAWEQASERAEEPIASVSRLYAERAGDGIGAGSLLLRAAVRVYATVEPEPAPAGIGLWDLQAGAFDAGAPEEWTFRHRAYLPAESVGAVRFEWPSTGGAAALIVRYRDPDLPPDVVWLAPGTAHAVSLPGVARIDWVVAGANPAGPAAPVFFEAASGYPYAGLVPRASASADGARVVWTTASHGSLAGWAVFREEVLADGRIARTGPEIVPAATDSAESYRYAYLDPGARPGTYYRYTVWAVTDEGLMTRAFSATLKPPE